MHLKNKLLQHNMVYTCKGTWDLERFEPGALVYFIVAIYFGITFYKKITKGYLSKRMAPAFVISNIHIVLGNYSIGS